MLHIGLVFERTYSNWTNKSMFRINFFPTTTQIYKLPEMEHHWNNLELNSILSHLWCMACNWTPFAFPKCKPAQIQPDPISSPVKQFGNTMWLFRAGYLPASLSFPPRLSTSAITYITQYFHQWAKNDDLASICFRCSNFLGTVLLDFVQMRGGGGLIPNFLSTFHKLYMT